MTDPKATDIDRRRLRRAIYLYLIAVSLIVAALLIGKAGVSYLYDNAALLAAILFLYLPLIDFKKTGEDLNDYGFCFGDYLNALKVVLVVCLITFPPFIFGFHLWQKFFGAGGIAPGLPDQAFSLVLTQLAVVALPEEAFYRGYLQTRFDRVFSARIKFLGAELGWSIPIVSALFAIGHVVAWGSLARANVFFPSIVFGYLRAKTGSIFAGVIYHAACNILVAVLLASV